MLQDIPDTRAELDALQRKLLHSSGDPELFAAELEQTCAGLPQRINADPEGVERGLAKLVLTLIELIRQLMERQALHRMERGTVSDAEIERLGETFMRLEQRMEELKVIFGLENEDLNLDLGPLGQLL
ncbi:MAG: gas vesicle protein K [Candidatus Viridilinea halotolerans]|uniref:Gas vesicle protein K n=1 Tax=Candidatus Viridilinea halotolerans TaxID=2491704 RepID=A0A426U4M7_9CHLR|nr:MAG: gas vesicle protein K [Candidatus Viridilinea halotolerans]